METTTQNSAATVPTVSASIPRTLAIGVVTTNILVAGVAASLLTFTHRNDWWPALIASVIVAALCAAASVVVLSKAAGRTIDWLVTFVMGTSAVRMGVSLIGLIVAVKGFNTPAEPTGFLICGFFAATLIVETTLLSRVTRKSTPTAIGATVLGEAHV